MTLSSATSSASLPAFRPAPEPDADARITVRTRSSVYDTAEPTVRKRGPFCPDLRPSICAGGSLPLTPQKAGAAAKEKFDGNLPKRKNAHQKTGLKRKRESLRLRPVFVYSCLARPFCSSPFAMCPRRFLFSFGSKTNCPARRGSQLSPIRRADPFVPFPVSGTTVFTRRA